MPPIPISRRAVLPLGFGLLAAGCAQPTVQSQPSRTILELLSSDGVFTRFVEAAGRSGVGQTLSSPGPLTVFAFTDSGWGDLPVFAQQSLMQQDTLRLAAVMNHLIVDGRHTLESLAGQERSYTTRNGTRLTVNARDAGRIRVESAGGSGLGAGFGSIGLRSARVLRGDVLAANGVVHILDGIIVP